jgi:hypothetical protein
MRVATPEHNRIRYLRDTRLRATRLATARSTTARRALQYVNPSTANRRAAAIKDKENI